MRTQLLSALLSCAIVGATVNGNRGPDGREIHCDFPGELHRRNTTSRGQGCCVWTSIHHAAVWQNEPAYQEAPRWIQEHDMPGGAYSGSVERYLPEMARSRGYSEPPAFINYEGNNLELLRAACAGGRMPAVTYCYSPSGRYGGKTIAHMVSLLHLDDKYAAVLDNNFPGANAIEWLSIDEFRKTYTGLGGGWAVILLSPPPPPPPRN